MISKSVNRKQRVGKYKVYNKDYDDNEIIKVGVDGLEYALTPGVEVELTESMYHALMDAVETRYRYNDATGKNDPFEFKRYFIETVEAFDRPKPGRKSKEELARIAAEEKSAMAELQNIAAQEAKEEDEDFEEQEEEVAEAV